MPGRMFRPRMQRPDPSHECEYREAVARVRIELEQLQAMHGTNTMISSAKVLDLLKANGMWRYINQDTGPMPAAADDGDVDPITGCRSVAARPQSGLDRVQQAVQDSRGGPPPPQVQGYA